MTFVMEAGNIFTAASRSETISLVSAFTRMK